MARDACRGSILGLAGIAVWELFGVDGIEHLISVLWERRGRPITGNLAGGEGQCACVAHCNGRKGVQYSVERHHHSRAHRHSQ